MYIRKRKYIGQMSRHACLKGTHRDGVNTGKESRESLPKWLDNLVKCTHLTLPEIRLADDGMAVVGLFMMMKLPILPCAEKLES